MLDAGFSFAPVTLILIIALHFRLPTKPVSGDPDDKGNVTVGTNVSDFDVDKFVCATAGRDERELYVSILLLILWTVFVFWLSRRFRRENNRHKRYARITISNGAALPGRIPR